MAQTTGATSHAPPPPAARGSSGGGWASGLVLFAGVMMVANGILGLFEGVVAVAKQHVYVSTPNYVFRFTLYSWGWVHIVVSALVLIVGLGVIAGQAWARATGIFIVALSLLANFMFLPYYPFWSLIVLAIDVFVLWALCTYHPQPRR
ncbi:hypothetical protein [Streptomyces sp. ICBB 8177]|uniref:DUF7144 family membrane protein n=1 Tax=Streptomyces sp. ICBB 8177 TaxID=563922 RepID=UPI001F540281|nr:hypothetical protein [Streptomyces sp. ICBB 8177]